MATARCSSAPTPWRSGPFTNRIAYLEDGDYVAIDHDGAQIFDAAGKPVERAGPASSPPPPPWWRRATTGTSWRRRSMTSRRAASTPSPAYVDTARPARPPCRAASTSPRSSASRSSPAAPPTIAGLIGKYLIEQLADLPVDVEIASEFRYREPALRPGTLAIAMSQSGETADTLAALRCCKAKGHADRGRGQRPRNRPWPARSTWSGRPTRAGDRRRLHQGLHRPGQRADRAGHRRRPRARPDRRGRGEAPGAACCWRRRG